MRVSPTAPTHTAFCGLAVASIEPLRDGSGTQASISVSTVNPTDPPTDGSTSTESQIADAPTKRPTIPTGPPHHLTQVNDLTRGLKWLSERSKVFVVIDLEFWEFRNDDLTEIGIAVYDPTRLPKDSHPIVPKIKSCHFVVEENKHRTNGKFVPDNMFKYSYGETLIMKMADCKTAVNTILESLAKNNNLVILGHGVSGDIRMLRKEGFTIPKHEILDTNTIWRITRPEGFGSLTKLLVYFNIPHALMHNAGNDAYLNLYLFLVLCDPEVRREMKLDEKQVTDGPTLVSCSQEKKGRGRRRDLKPPSRRATSNEAIDLMIT